MGEADRVLQLIGISKSFPGVNALDRVSLDLERNMILGLVGENGAGKSTLMKVLSGAYRMDGGEIRLNGETVHIPSPSVGRDLGISIIYQELSVLRNLTVVENLFLGNLRRTRFRTVDWASMRRDAREALRALELEIDVDTPMADLNIAQCQMVEICRAAVVNRAKVLIMDEPTSSLVDTEIEHMFGAMRRLKEQGVSIIYITHRLEELFEITDEIAVMKDGKNSGRFVTAEVSKEDIVRAMVGRELGDYYPPHGSGRGKPLLEVKNLSWSNRVSDISFTAYAGEILGFAGLIGAGRTETMMAIFGALDGVTGEVTLDGKPVKFVCPSQAIAGGIALLPEDRRLQGLVQIFSINHNTSLANLRGICGRLGLMDLRKETEVAKGYVEKLKTATPSIQKRVSELSGGNQQKVIVGKWLYTDAKVLIFDEPTKGIDVGAKAEIYRIMRRLADEGAAVIMVSSDLPEIIGVSDRILVMHNGRLHGELDHADATEDRIMRAAIGEASAGTADALYSEDRGMVQ